MTEIPERSAACERRWIVTWDRRLRGGWRCYRTAKGGVAIWTPLFSVTVRRPASGNRRAHVGPQFVGAWIAGRYVSLRGPRHRAYFSERNRIKTRVLPLLGGWRIVVKESQVG